MCYYFDNIMKIEDINFDNILLDKKSYKTYENILIFMAAKSLCIRFDEIDRFNKIYDGIR